MEYWTMRCDECGSPVTTERNSVRRYDIGGLPHVELHGVGVTRCPGCGKEGIAIPRVGHLHRVLAKAFVTQRRMLAPVEIRFLRKHIGLSAVDFAQRMGVARETISRWETGANPMGAVADRLLRLLVVTHEPTKSYAVDGFLRELDDEPAPPKLSSVPMWNSRDSGWTAQERPELARG
jgi:putative zinc finger/helix-turn-helix YgiT family protein